MTDAQPGVLLDEHAGLVHAPFDRVRDAVLTIRTGTLAGTDVPLILSGQAGQTVVITGGPARFTTTVSGAPLTLEVDPAAGWVQAKGQWWWCGRLEVHEDPAGARLVRRTYNLAGGLSGRLVPLTVGRGHDKRAVDGLHANLAVLGERLSCRTEFLR
ncbi:hypothetical protein ORV05_29920 [Amycolatopsis cynarae]|uniref:SRPBCC family protein n=1 Tax=Amycolatopsis cynarae TaxID=2995223 RepID=A0ABY7B2S0_9PSEU|nr:hypothetical protein [Amycolatopsis sp. HUAS 11-8]WAL65093.1 hypothetical protein ORV05_29920 [Amycolatopsis sp. HUAS 11-8]